MSSTILDESTIQVIRGQPGKPEPEIQTVTAK